MTEKEAKKHIIATVPAILTGSAALVAALTTTYIGLRDSKPAAPDKPVVVATAVPTAATPSKPVQALVDQRLQLKIERIAVHHDGTVGTTDWRFAVEIDGEPRFTFEQDELTDEGGRNIAMPKDAMTTLQLSAGKPAKITIKGWRQSRLRTDPPEPDALGEGQLNADGKVAPIEVAAAQPDAGAFTFYVTSAEDRQ